MYAVVQGVQGARDEWKDNLTYVRHIQFGCHNLEYIEDLLEEQATGKANNVDA